VSEAEFVRADILVEKAIKGFEGIYRAYNNDMVSYEDVLNYIDDEPIIKDLFYEPIYELIDDFMDWLKSTFEGD